MPTEPLFTVKEPTPFNKTTVVVFNVPVEPILSIVTVCVSPIKVVQLLKDALEQDVTVTVFVATLSGVTGLVSAWLNWI